MDWAFILALWGGGDNGTGTLGLGLSKKEKREKLLDRVNTRSDTS